MARVDVHARMAKICLAMPEVTERLSHGAPTWFVRARPSFLSLMVDGHHAHTFPHLVCAAPAGVQAEMVQAEPARFFVPPYVGGRGWIGVRLDVAVDWDELRAIARDAYLTVAPKRLAALLDEP